jgi:hypothetical protein
MNVIITSLSDAVTIDGRAEMSHIVSHESYKKRIYKDHGQVPIGQESK